MRRHSNSDVSYYEGEESEYEGEEEENSRDDYYQGTDQSNEEDRSLIDHTTTQYIRNKDIASGILFKQSQSDSTIDKNQITDENFYNHQNYINSEDEEEEDEKEFNDGSEISGIDSLSQTHLSKLNSNKLNKNKRFNRRDHARMTGNFPKARNDSSQYNGTDSIGLQEGTQSIGFKSRNNKNDESLSLTPSNDSWGAITPRQPDFNKKTLKAKVERLNINEFDSKPINSHYINDDSKRFYKGASEDTDNNLKQSNFSEEPDHVNSKTIERNSRNKKAKSRERQRDRNKNNSLIKAAGNLPRDSELESALSHLDNSNNHISLKDSNGMKSDFHDAVENNLSEIELKKIKMELNQYKAECYKLRVENRSFENERNEHIREIAELNRKLIAEENRAKNMEDCFHTANDIINESDKKNISKNNNQKLFRLREEIEQLSKENFSLDTRIKEQNKEIEKYREIESYFLGEINKKESEIIRIDVYKRTIENQTQEINKLKKEVNYWRENLNMIENTAHSELNKLDNQNLKYVDIIRELKSRNNELETELNNNRHLVEKDQKKNIELLDEHQMVRKKLNEIMAENEEYKRLSNNNPMSLKIDFDKEIQKRDQIHLNKMQSLHLQIDEWKSKSKEYEQEVKTLNRQIKKLENIIASNTNNSSTRVGEQSEILETIDKIRDIFGIMENDNILNELDKINEDIETIPILKEELNKAERVINKINEENKNLKCHLESNINAYSKDQINVLNEEISNLRNENSQINQKYNELESIYKDSKHEYHSLASNVNELKGKIFEKESEIKRLKMFNEKLENDAETLKLASKEIIKQKKEVELKLEEATKLDSFDKMKSNKEIESIKSEITSLIEFIMSLDLAYDEEFAKLIKNQSYINEYDQARKYLQNQKQMVELMIDRYESSIQSFKNEISKYKDYIDQLEKSNMISEEYKSEAIEWKQNFARLAVTTKGSASDLKEHGSLIDDYQKLQVKFSDLNKENKKFGIELSDKNMQIEKLQSINNENNLMILKLQEEINQLHTESKKSLKKSGIDKEAEILNIKNSNLILRLEKDLNNYKNE